MGFRAVRTEDEKTGVDSRGTTLGQSSRSLRKGCLNSACKHSDWTTWLLKAIVPRLAQIRFDADWICQMSTNLIA